MSNSFKLKDAPIAGLQATVLILQGFGNGNSTERQLPRGLSLESKQSKPHLRRLLGTFARESDEAKEELERRGLMPEDPDRAARKRAETQKVVERRLEENKRRCEREDDQRKSAKRPKIKKGSTNSKLGVRLQGWMYTGPKEDVRQQSMPKGKATQEDLHVDEEE